MRYIEAPEEYGGSDKSLFLAGGITNCENWQIKLVELLADQDIILLNPRRKKYPENNPNIDKEQITWEHEHLKKATAVSFWFSNETLCPITLFELGKLLMSNKKIFVGVHPLYRRKKDVEIQTKLIQPEIKILYSLEEIAHQIKEWLRVI